MSMNVKEAIKWLREHGFRAERYGGILHVWTVRNDMMLDGVYILISRTTKWCITCEGNLMARRGPTASRASSRVMAML